MKLLILYFLVLTLVVASLFQEFQIISLNKAVSHLTLQVQKQSMSGESLRLQGLEENQKRLFEAVESQGNSISALTNAVRVTWGAK